MSIYNWGLNNIFMNNFIPMPIDPFGGLNPFCSGFGYPNSLFNFMMPQFNIFPSFQPFMPLPTNNSIFTGFLPSMNTNLFSMPFMSNPFDFVLPNSVYTAGLEGLNIPSFGSLSMNTINKTNNSAEISKTANTKNTNYTYRKVQLDKPFLDRVKQIAKKINCDYKDLLAIMNSESGLNPGAWHGKSAVGLIQFTDICLEEINKTYGTSYTKEQVAQMSGLEQLDLVEKILTHIKKLKFPADKKLSAGDLYAMIFAPSRADKEVLYKKGSDGYASNPLDLDKDGAITKKDLENHLKKKQVDVSA